MHGGYVGMLVDEAMALVATKVAGVPAMTRRIELDFTAPTLSSAPVTLRVRAEQNRSQAVVIALTGEQGEPPDLLRGQGHLHQGGAVCLGRSGARPAGPPW